MCKDASFCASIKEANEATLMAANEAAPRAANVPSPNYDHDWRMRCLSDPFIGDKCAALCNLCSVAQPGSLQG